MSVVPSSSGGGSYPIVVVDTNVVEQRNHLHQRRVVAVAVDRERPRFINGSIVRGGGGGSDENKCSNEQQPRENCRWNNK